MCEKINVYFLIFSVLFYFIENLKFSYRYGIWDREF